MKTISSAKLGKYFNFLASLELPAKLSAGARLEFVNEPLASLGVVDKSMLLACAGKKIEIFAELFFY